MFGEHRNNVLLSLENVFVCNTNSYSTQVVILGLNKFDMYMVEFDEALAYGFFRCVKQIFVYCFYVLVT